MNAQQSTTNNDWNQDYEFVVSALSSLRDILSPQQQAILDELVRDDDDWEEVGQVVVDSGQIMVIDPGNEGETTELADGSLVMETCKVGPVGIVVTTGMGDGIYPVKVRLDKDASDVIGGGVIGIRIDCGFDELQRPFPETGSPEDDSMDNDATGG